VARKKTRGISAGQKGKNKNLFCVHRIPFCWEGRAGDARASKNQIANRDWGETCDKQKNLSIEIFYSYFYYSEESPGEKENKKSRRIMERTAQVEEVESMGRI